MLELLAVATLVSVLVLAFRVSRLERSVRRLRRVLDRPRKELEELEDERESIHDLMAHMAADEEDLDRLRVIEEKLARRAPRG